MLKLCAPILFATAFIACNQNVCVNSSSVISNNSPASLAYQKALAEIIETKGKELVYTIQDIRLSKSDSAIVLKITSDSLCAELTVKFDKWIEKEKIFKSKGMGYRHAKIEDPTISIQKRDNGILFNLLSSKSIQD